VTLANDAVTKVRRRVTWELRDRRGRRIDPEWANRRRLLRARECLSPNTFVKMWNRIQDEDPSAQILSAWIAKEELRTLLSTVRVGGDAHLTRHRLHRFPSWYIDSHIPELLTLAGTVDHWWPEINAFISTGITNARTEGYNRLLKQVKRVGCGFRNPDNSARRIRFHCTRKTAGCNPDRMLIARSKLKSHHHASPRPRNRFHHSSVLRLCDPGHDAASDQRRCGTGRRPGLRPGVSPSWPRWPTSTKTSSRRPWSATVPAYGSSRSMRRCCPARSPRGGPASRHHRCRRRYRLCGAAVAPAASP
jgi:hypothetical protein